MFPSSECESTKKLRVNTRTTTARLAVGVLFFPAVSRSFSSHARGFIASRSRRSASRSLRDGFGRDGDERRGVSVSFALGLRGESLGEGFVDVRVSSQPRDPPPGRGRAAPRTKKPNAVAARFARGTPRRPRPRKRKRRAGTVGFFFFFFFFAAAEPSVVLDAREHALALLVAARSAFAEVREVSLAGRAGLRRRRGARAAKRVGGAAAVPERRRGGAAVRGVGVGRGGGGGVFSSRDRRVLVDHGLDQAHRALGDDDPWGGEE